MDTLPQELLLSILSYLAPTANSQDLGAFSATSQAHQASTALYRSQVLLTRLAGIRDAGRLMQVWTPPAFFHPNHGQSSSTSYPWTPTTISQEGITSLLVDDGVYTSVYSYLTSLVNRIAYLDRITHHLTSPGARLAAWSSQSVWTALLHLWSIQPRYSHDIDGHWYWTEVSNSGPTDMQTVISLMQQDSYFSAFDGNTFEATTGVYSSLCWILRPPFYGSSSAAATEETGEGVWLWRLIIKVSRDFMTGSVTIIWSRKGLLIIKNLIS
jgi:hypothetical protein